LFQSDEPNPLPQACGWEWIWQLFFAGSRRQTCPAFCGAIRRRLLAGFDLKTLLIKI
jgi:hypothetical protein